MRHFAIGSAEVGGARPLIVAGPCVVESEALCLEVATHLKALCEVRGLPFVFKASYRKANRSSGASYSGPGTDEGLAVLAQVKRTLGVPVLTDVHDEAEVPAAAEVADVWGPTADNFPIMQRLKREFDPHHVLNPGRFVGGL